MLLRSTGLTNVGLRRENNEDAFMTMDVPGLYAVADGMGGHSAGEVASGLAIDVLKKIPKKITEAKLVDTHKLIHKVLMANMENNPERRSMGTTLTAALVSDGKVHIAHVSDSACFLVRDGRAKKLTIDQSSGPVLFNCLGSRDDAFCGAQYVDEQLQQNDLLILCTDGLTNYLKNDQQIADLIRGPQSLEQYAQALIDHALKSGGSDNVTVVIVLIPFAMSEQDAVTLWQAR